MTSARRDGAGASIASHGCAARRTDWFHRRSRDHDEDDAAAGPYSPDLDPIEMAFEKLKAHLRRIGARTIDDLWKAVGSICDLYDPVECRNYFAPAGYASD